jgi:hypothetical protein
VCVCVCVLSTIIVIMTFAPVFVASAHSWALHWPHAMTTRNSSRLCMKHLSDDCSANWSFIELVIKGDCLDSKNFLNVFYPFNQREAIPSIFKLCPLYLNHNLFYQLC